MRDFETKPARSRSQIIAGLLAIIGPAVILGIAAQWFQALLKREVTPDVATIAAGDAPNDRELLEMADYALLMRNARGKPLELRRSGPTWLSDSAGPIAWAKGISDILTSMGWDI